MTALRLAPVILTCALTAGAPATADICALSDELNAFIAARSDLTPAAGCPQVAPADFTGTEIAHRSQAAAYYPASGRIALADDLDLGTVLGRSYLLHELVHAAQYASGTAQAAACPQALEWDAYRLQAEYLRDAGLGREAVMMRVTAGVVAQCGGTEGY